MFTGFCAEILSVVNSSSQAKFRVQHFVMCPFINKTFPFHSETNRIYPPLIDLREGSGLPYGPSVVLFDIFIGYRSNNHKKSRPEESRDYKKEGLIFLAAILLLIPLAPSGQRHRTQALAGSVD